MESHSKDVKDFIVLNLIFILVCSVVLFLPFIAIGIKFFILVLTYNVLIPSFSLWKGYNEWINIWLFSLILSILQVFPDWFLSAQLNVLVFPEDGFVKIGTVSGYMAGLWVIPFFTILFIGLKVQSESSKFKEYLVVSIISLIIFGGAEMTLWAIGSWYAQNVHTIFGHIAIYIIIPEVILGIAVFYYYNLTAEKNLIWKILSAFLVMLLYLGATAFFYLVFETLIFNF
ncbi:MAG: DUF6989 domain-containing protein [Promethearchaeota archaeon]